MDSSQKQIKRLYDTIQDSGLTYVELSERTGIAKSALQRYATGETLKIPIDRIIKIASVLGVSAEYLLCWTDEPQRSSVAKSAMDQTAERKPTMKSLINELHEVAVKLEDFKLTSMESTLLESFRAMTDKQKQKLITMIQLIKDD